MRLDAHQHFWRYSPEEYPWIQHDWPIRRNFLPEDLALSLRKCGLDGCIAVQARQTLEETRWLLALAEASPIIRGVVGWVDLRSPKLDEQLSEFSAHPKLVGVRHVVQDEPDDRFLMREDFQRGIGRLRDFRLTYDLLIFPRQLQAAIELAARFPNQPFVLDHVAKPCIRDATLSPWREQIQELAQLQNVSCKVSGMVTEARWHGWQDIDFFPFLDVVFSAFGPDRLMYGSDWPVALLAASYEQVFTLVDKYLDRQPQDVRAKVLGLNAARFYDL
jgi:L-fuconolactonase